MNKNPNIIVWCDIPVKDLDRAIRFYSKVMAFDVAKVPLGPDTFMGILPHEGGVGGCLFESDEVSPSAQGPLIYFNANDRLEGAEKLVTEMGGKVLEARHAIGPHGFRTVALDSEGNRIALHSEK